MAETGLNQNVNRDYGGGRYIEADPIGLRGGSLSLYAYVRNNPIFSVDPFGLADMCRIRRSSRRTTLARVAGSLTSAHARTAASS